MTIKYEPKVSQSDTNEGRAYQNAYYLDDSATDGRIAIGKLFGLKSDGSTKGYNATVATTMIEADASSGVKAVGMVYRESAPDQNLRADRVKFNPDPYYYVYGDREAQELVPLKNGGVAVIDSEREFHFNTVKEVMTGTVEVVGGALGTVAGTGTAFTTEFRIGDYVNIDGEKREVLTIADDATMTVTADFTGAKPALTAVYVDSDLERPLWVGDSGLFRKSTPQTGEWKQLVGYVENGNDIRVEISPVGEIVA